MSVAQGLQGSSASATSFLGMCDLLAADVPGGCRWRPRLGPLSRAGPDFSAPTSAASDGPVNIGNPEEHSILELAELILDLTGSASEVVFSPLPQDDPARRRPDITLAREALGWAPETDLAEGLAPTVEWFMKVAAGGMRRA